jgi:hypothetical protein
MAVLKKTIKMADISTEQQEILKGALPNNFQEGDFVWKINSRVATADQGGKGYYWCPADSCEASCVVVCDASGSEVTISVKKPHSCIKADLRSILIDAKQDMELMVKNDSLDNPAKKASKIAMDVFKHFEDTMAGKNNNFM